MSLQQFTMPPAASADAQPPGRSSILRRGVSLSDAAPVLLSLALLGTWELTVRVLDIKAYLLPAPSRIWEELVKEAPLLWRHTGVTFYETLLGFGLAVVVGIGLALLFVSWPPIEGAVMPLLIFSQTVPKISIAPLLLIWFGNVGPIPKAAVTFLICFFPIVIDSAIGLRSVPPEMLHLVRSMGANRWQVFTKLRVPAALPYIFSGLKVAATLAVVGAVIGEWVGADRGLGYILLRASGELQTPLGFAAIAVLTAIGILLYYAMEGLERLMVPWHVSRRAPRPSPRAAVPLPLAVIAVLSALLTAACAPATPSMAPTVSPVRPTEASGPAAGSVQLTELPFRLNWTLYGEHAFFYTALEKGFYREQGLDVKIQEGSGSANVLKQVGAGSDPIGYVDTPTVMRGVAEGVPARLVLVVQQKGPASVIYRADNPIKTPSDLRGKKIAWTAGDLFSSIFPAFLAANNLTQDEVDVISLPTPAAKEAALLQGQIDGFLGFYNDQPLRMMDREKSAKLEWMPFFDHGVNVLSTGIVVNEQFLKEKPEVVRSFLAGTVRGIQYEKANPDEASEIFSKYAPSFHKELAKQEIEQTLPLLETENTRGQPTGCMSLKDFQSTYELLVRYGSLKAGLDPAMFFTNDYLPAKCPG